MAEEASAVKDDQVAQDTTPTDPAPAENKSPEAAEEGDEFDNPFEPSKEETETESGEESGEQTEESQTAEETESQPQSKAEERKQQLNTEIRDLVSQRNTLRQQVEQMNSQAYQPATEDELLEQVNPETGKYYNSVEAKLAAMEQRQEMERYNNQIADNQLTLSSEAHRALQDFPMFDPDSGEYSEEVSAQADQLLQANLVFDQNTGQVIGSHVSPYQLYKTIASASKSSETSGQLKGQKSVEQMLSNADSAPGASQPQSKVDPIKAIWDDDSI